MYVHRRNLAAPRSWIFCGLLLGQVLASSSSAQETDGAPSRDGREERDDRTERRRRGPGGRGPGGPGGFGASIKVLEKFDADKNGRLDAAERKPARAWVVEERTKNPPRGPGRRGPGGRRGGGASEPASPGPRVAVDAVPYFPDAALYDPSALRTIFLEFESDDWEKELADFNNTDVDIPARLTVDGRTYENVGVHFRGQSSFGRVPEGRKRSLNLSMDFVDGTQRLYGYRTLNLLNGHSDPSLLHAVLFSQIARHYIASPRANFARVVINGESWGVYVNAQQFNKDLVRDFFATTKGSRWKAPGSPGGRASLSYLGENPKDYRQIYRIRSKDRPEAWSALIRLCKVLEETPPADLVAALEPILDIDGALWFLALENVFVNGDGYWVRTSDYNLYLDPRGRFHLIPHDTNETFSARSGGPRRRGRRGPPRGQRGEPDGPPPGADGPPEGGGAPGGGGRPPREFGGPPGRSGGRGQGGLRLDPLFGADDDSKPLISKLLAVPELRQRYLEQVRELTEKWLDWERIGPLARQHHELIAEHVRTETRLVDPLEEFLQAVDENGEGRANLKAFVDGRRAFLLERLGELESESGEKAGEASDSPEREF